MIEKEGFIRIDLLGGTLDLNPINVILENVVTLNCAISRKAKVVLKKGSSEGIEIISKDYNSAQFFPKSDFTPQKLREGHFKSMILIAKILDSFGVHEGLTLELESGSPPGAGLGGSSAMGLTFLRALANG